MDDVLSARQLEAFTQRIDRAWQKSAELYQSLAATDPAASAIYQDTLAQLQEALEVIRGTLAEMQQQQDCLIEFQTLIVAERQRYQDLFELSPEAYLVTDLEGTIYEANQAMTVLLGRSKTQLSKMSAFLFFPPEQRQILRNHLEPLQVGERVQDWASELQLPSGRRQSVVVTVNRFQDVNRPALRWLIQDIAPFKQAELALQQMNQALEWRVQQRTEALLQSNQQLQRVNARLIQEITQRRQAEIALKRQASQARLVETIAYRIRQSLNLDEILATTVAEVRQFLRVDRVIIYRFQPDGSGIVAVESVAADQASILNTVIEEPCLPANRLSHYREGWIGAIADVQAEDLSPCYLSLLANFQVRANLVVPICQGDTLWGLLVAHQCSGPRPWQPAEISLLKQLSTQVAIAIQQSELYQRVQRLARIDELTQLANRRHFETYLEETWQRLVREAAPLSFLLADVDFFKAYNDIYGHPRGDTCLQQVASVLPQVIKRPADLVARYGGEEFAIILPNTDLNGAQYLAEALVAAIKALDIEHRGSDLGVLTLSVGVASIIPNRQTTSDQLIRAADEALYRAKREGRDRVVAIKISAEFG